MAATASSHESEVLKDLARCEDGNVAFGVGRNGIPSYERIRVLQRRLVPTLRTGTCHSPDS